LNAGNQKQKVMADGIIASLMLRLKKNFVKLMAMDIFKIGNWRYDRILELRTKIPTGG
jgi:hypothetical protein